MSLYYYLLRQYDNTIFVINYWNFNFIVNCLEIFLCYCCTSYWSKQVTNELKGKANRLHLWMGAATDMRLTISADSFLTSIWCSSFTFFPRNIPKIDPTYHPLSVMRLFIIDRAQSSVRCTKCDMHFSIHRPRKERQTQSMQIDTGTNPRMWVRPSQSLRS